MNGRELVRRAVKFEKPDRVPRDLPEPWGSDFIWVDMSANPDWKGRVEGEDEWGCVWEHVSPNDKSMGQVKVHPLEDYGKLADYSFPNYDIPARYEEIARKVKENREDKFVLCGVPMSLIHRLDYMRGNINAMTDPYLHPEELNALLKKITDINLTVLEHLKDLGVDGILSADDWGLQDRPVMSPAIFREFFRPHYKRYYKKAHEYGMLTFLHSCGHIAELLDDFIDAELDVIQMDQQQNMGIKNLAKRFGGRLCFWCPVDIQNTMIKGSVDAVRTYARMLIEKLGAFDGGFIAKWYPAPEAVGHTPEKIKAMSEAFIEYGSYNRGTGHLSSYS